MKADQAFHGALVRLLVASRDGDVTATTRKLGVVRDGCTSCHVRFPAATSATEQRAGGDR